MNSSCAVQSHSRRGVENTATEPKRPEPQKGWSGWSLRNNPLPVADRSDGCWFTGVLPASHNDISIGQEYGVVRICVPLLAEKLANWDR